MKEILFGPIWSDTNKLNVPWFGDIHISQRQGLILLIARETHLLYKGRKTNHQSKFPFSDVNDKSIFHFSHPFIWPFITCSIPPPWWNMSPKEPYLGGEKERWFKNKVETLLGKFFLSLPSKNIIYILISKSILKIEFQ